MNTADPTSSAAGVPFGTPYGRPVPTEGVARTLYAARDSAGVAHLTEAAPAEAVRAICPGAGELGELDRIDFAEAEGRWCVDCGEYLRYLRAGES